MDHPQSSTSRHLLNGVNVRRSHVYLALVLVVILSLLSVGAHVILASSLITFDIKPASIIEGNSGLQVVNFTVKLSQAVGTGQQIVIDMSSVALPPGPNAATQGNKAVDPNADYNSTPTTLTFNPGDTQHVFPVTVYGDTLDEFNEGFIVRATVATSTVPGIVTGNVFETQGIIIDDDNPTVQSISAPTVTETVDATIDFVVTLDRASLIGEDISIAYQTVDGTAVGGVDFTGASAGRLLIPAGSITGTITIPLIDTLVNKPTTTFQLELLEASSLSVNVPFVQTLATGTILDENDAPVIDANGALPGIDGVAGFIQTSPPTSNPTGIASNLTVSDPENDQISSVVVTITDLVDPAAEVLDVNVGATGITKNYNATTGTLTLTGPVITGTMQTVLRTLTYGNNSPTPGVMRTISLVATDNGTPPGPATNNPVATIVIGINALPPTASNDIATVFEDIAKPIDVLANDNAGGGAKMIVSVDTTGTNGTVTFTATSLTYQSNPNYCNNGTSFDIFTYTINGGSTATVRVMVTCVNDPPSLAPGADVSVVEDSGAYSATWFDPLTISPGPGETVQTPFILTTSNDNNALFSVQPSVDIISGTLTFTPAANANGSALVTVTLKDNGGTANNGIDTTLYTFTITVTPVNDPATVTSIGLTVDEGGQSTITKDMLAANDVDTPLLDLTFTISSTVHNGQLRITDGISTIVLSNGSTFKQSDIDSGRLNYTHDGSNTIADDFTFTMNDGTLGTFLITINPVNDAPVLTLTTGAADYQLGNPAVVIDAGATVTDSDSLNLNNGKLTIVLTNSGVGDVLGIPNQGSGAGQVGTSLGSGVLFSGVQVGTFTRTSTTVSSTVTTTLEITFNINATPAAAQALAQNITFSNMAPITTPGSRVAIFTVNDGLIDSQARSKTITFNQPPITVDDTVNVTINSIAEPIAVLKNDSDADGDTIIITAVIPATHGKTAIDSSGSYVTYTPDTDYLGADSFTYTISDGKASTTGTVNVTVKKCVIYIPLAANPPYADLVVSFTVSPAVPTGGERASIAVTVTNRGEAAASNFWVDFYIDPTSIPVVNTRWNDLCRPSTKPYVTPPCYGLAWFYAGTLAPGQSVVLSSRPQDVTNPNGYLKAYSYWPGYFYNGATKLYALVDSWNQDASGKIRDPNGAVFENFKETNNLSSQDITVKVGVLP